MDGAAIEGRLALNRRRAVPRVGDLRHRGDQTAESALRGAGLPLAFLLLNVQAHFPFPRPPELARGVRVERKAVTFDVPIVRVTRAGPVIAAEP